MLFHEWQETRFPVFLVSYGNYKNVSPPPLADTLQSVHITFIMRRLQIRKFPENDFIEKKFSTT